jgi:autotransporter strand-loop-strand O-heptosyltransferase
LNSLGYSVVVIQKQSTTLKNVIDRTGDLPLEDRISDLLGCEFFIGIGSGLSWLAWALNTPVVMISGFSQPFFEFSDNTLRIINTNVCHGCFNNPDHKFDKGDWWWCPEHKNTSRHFECTKTITPKEVLRQILNSNIIEGRNKLS